MKPHLLFFINRSPIPSIDGTRERILNELKTISHYYQIDLWVIGTEKISEKNKNELTNICGGEVKITTLSKLSCSLRSLRGLISANPLQTFYFYNKSTNKDILKTINKYQAIYFHTIRFGKYAEQIKEKFPQKNKIILFDFNDAISLNYKHAAITAVGPWKLIYKIEENRVKNYELKLLQKFLHFSIITNRDREYILNNWQKKYHRPYNKKIWLTRYPVKNELFNYNYQPTDKNLVFIGNLLYPPNIQGLVLFCKKIWPLILKADPKLKLLIIGRGTNRVLKTYKNVETLGFIDNPYSLMTNQYLFLNPINFGGGISTKTLMSMAIGLPVISTVIGASGIEGVKDGKNIIFIDYNNPEKSSEIIIKATNDIQKLKMIGLGGKNLVNKLYKKSKNDLDLINFINSSIS